MEPITTTPLKIFIAKRPLGGGGWQWRVVRERRVNMRVLVALMLVRAPDFRGREAAKRPKIGVVFAAEILRLPNLLQEPCTRAWEWLQVAGVCRDATSP